MVNIAVSYVSSVGWKANLITTPIDGVSTLYSTGAAVNVRYVEIDLTIDVEEEEPANPKRGKCKE